MMQSTRPTPTMSPNTNENTIHSPHLSYWNALPTSAGSPAVIINAVRYRPRPATALTTIPMTWNTNAPARDLIATCPMSESTIWAATGMSTTMSIGPTFSWNFFQPYEMAVPTSGAPDPGRGASYGGGGGGGGRSVTGQPPVGTGRR